MSVIKQVFKTDRRCMQKFIVNMGLKGMVGFAKYKKRKKKGQAFPAFQFISVTDDCNLKCQGCWITQGEKPSRMEMPEVDKIIEAGKKQGSYFYGILGGEPLMYQPLMDIFAKHQDCYFQLFTNGTLLSDKVAGQLRQLANVTPLISFEGDENVADIRRGGSNVYRKTMQAIENSTRHKLITGVAMSVCKSNIDMALSHNFVNKLVDKGVMYLWYYIYRPSGENPQYQLALNTDEINRLRRFMVEGRSKFSIVLIDAYWNGDGQPFCPAAEGLSHHINPSGYIEPCPVIQLATDNIKEGSLIDIYEQSDFLRDFRKSINHKTQGCILMEDPQWLYRFGQKHHAINTSNRPIGENLPSDCHSICSHGTSQIIPEKNWIYRFAKNRAFFGLGAYG